MASVYSLKIMAPICSLWDGKGIQWSVGGSCPLEIFLLVSNPSSWCFHSLMWVCVSLRAPNPRESVIFADSVGVLWADLTSLCLQESLSEITSGECQVSIQSAVYPLLCPCGSWVVSSDVSLLYMYVYYLADNNFTGNPERLEIQGQEHREAGEGMGCRRAGGVLVTTESV